MTCKNKVIFVCLFIIDVVVVVVIIIMFSTLKPQATLCFNLKY